MAPRVKAERSASPPSGACLVRVRVWVRVWVRVEVRG